MKRFLLSNLLNPIIVVFILLVSITTTNAQTDILTTSFEENALGTINGQGDWIIENGAASVTDVAGNVNTGNQSLNFTAINQTLVINNTTYSGSQAGVSGIVYFDMYVKINSMSGQDFAINGDDLFGGSQKRTFVMEFETPSGSTGNFQIYDGGSSPNVSPYTVGVWNRISARVDYTKDVYQVIFNGQEAVTASFRETYIPSASGSRQAGVKEYHSIRFNLGYDGAQGYVDAAVDDIYIGTDSIPGISFPVPDIYYSIDIEQPEIGSISLDPEEDEYVDGTEITATLTVPTGYLNSGWTGDLSGTELIKTFNIISNMEIGATVEVDTENPPPIYTITVTQPDTGEITLSPPGGTYYDYTTVTIELSVPAGYKNEGWTGDLDGTDLEHEIVIHQNMEIGATVIIDTTPPNVYTATSASQFHDLCQSELRPGDIIELADGFYDTGGISVRASGTASQPIIIRAANIGQAELGGGSYFNFRTNEYIILEGFHFTSDPNTVVKLEGCNNIRITRNIFQLTEDESAKWVLIGGYWDDGSIISHHNRVDHNIFRDKHQLGNFITIDGGDVVSQHDRIDHNYFYNIGPRHDNEMEAIRVGWSALSLTWGYTVIEYNLFEECDGDPEIISIKSCGDTVRYNTIIRSQGTVSLRHGDGSVVHDNYFFGDGKAGTGGVRVYARNHKIYNNYFEGLMGYRWDAAITLTNGDIDTGSLSAHWRIDNLIVSHNTLVNNFSNIEIGYDHGTSDPWTRVPRNVTLANNIIVGSEGELVNIITEPSNFTWSGNIMFPQGDALLGIDSAAGVIEIIDPELLLTDSLWLLSSTSPAINAAINNYIPIIDDIQGQVRVGIRDVGADEYSTTPVVRKPLTTRDVGPDSSYITPTPTAINFSINNNPDSYLLFKNYPNPFNPRTTLEYFLPEASNISINIYNLLGQKVASVVKENKPAGKHTIGWNGQSFSSGTYYAIIKTNNDKKYLKLLLIK